MSNFDRIVIKDVNKIYCEYADCKGITLYNLDKITIASGYIARHDPERMARAQLAGIILRKFEDGSMQHGISLDEETFIKGLLSDVRDGKI